MVRARQEPAPAVCAAVWALFLSSYSVRRILSRLNECAYPHFLRKSLPARSKRGGGRCATPSSTFPAKRTRHAGTFPVTDPGIPDVRTLVPHFTERAAIPAFSSEQCGPVADRARCNDNVHLESYVPAQFTFPDKQRREMHDACGGCSSRDGHARRALGGSFPLAQETPLAIRNERRISIGTVLRVK